MKRETLKTALHESFVPLLHKPKKQEKWKKKLITIICLENLIFHLIFQTEQPLM